MNSEPTTESLQSTRINYKHLALTLISVIAFSILITVLLSSNNPTNNSEQVTSFPVSQPETAVDLPLPLANIEFVNASQFIKSNIVTFESEFCTVPQTAIYPIDIDIYAYILQGNAIADFSTSSKLITYVSKNPRSIITSSDYIPTLDSLDNLFNGNYQAGSLRGVSKLFGRDCGGSFIIRAEDIVEPITYSNSDSTFIIVSHGSTQAVSNKDWMPIQLTFLFKKGQDYGYSTIFIDDYSSITTQNNLAQCEVITEFGFPAIEDDACVKNVINQDIDREKLNMLVEEWKRIFELN